MSRAFFTRALSASVLLSILSAVELSSPLAHRAYGNYFEVVQPVQGEPGGGSSPAGGSSQVAPLTASGPAVHAIGSSRTAGRMAVGPVVHATGSSRTVALRGDRGTAMGPAAAVSVRTCAGDGRMTHGLDYTCGSAWLEVWWAIWAHLSRRELLE